MPPLKAYWYEGFKKNATGIASDEPQNRQGADRNFPPLLAELQKQYPDEELDRPDSGTLYVGEKGILYTGTYGGKMHILPHGENAADDAAAPHPAAPQEHHGRLPQRRAGRARRRPPPASTTAPS